MQNKSKYNLYNRVLDKWSKLNSLFKNKNLIYFTYDRGIQSTKGFLLVISNN